MSERAVEIFREKLDSIEELKKPEKVGDAIIIKETDAIIYQVSEQDLLKRLDLIDFEMPYEIGLGDIKNRETNKTHALIAREIEKMLEKKIWKNLSGLLWLDENSKINLAFDEQRYNEFGGSDKEYSMSENFKKILKRYKVKKIWLCGEEKNKEIFERMKINVRNAQLKEFAGIHNMSVAEYLRFRATGVLEKDDQEEN